MIFKAVEAVVEAFEMESKAMTPRAMVATLRMTTRTGMAGFAIVIREPAGPSVVRDVQRITRQFEPSFF